jgi:Fe-S cluster biogenesis protein NfuA
MEGGTSVKEKVQQALNEIRPQMQADGGDIELIDVTEDGVVKVRLVGACSGCPGAQMTLQMGVERVLKARVPEVKAVEAV